MLKLNDEKLEWTATKMIEAGVKIYSEMACFTKARVSGKTSSYKF